MEQHKMLESWTIQKLVSCCDNRDVALEPTIKTLLSMRIESHELKNTILFRMKTFMDYCPCGCDTYTPKINIQDDLRVKYHDEQNLKERQKLGLA
jgi:hypothetical protein